MSEDRYQPPIGADFVCVKIVSALEDAQIPCAIGGAIALNFWAPPRGTKDADLNAFIGPDRYGELIEVLEQAGCEIDRPEFLRRAREGEVAVAQMAGMRVDVFLPSIPFDAEAQRTVKRAVLRKVEVPVLSAESVCVYKLLFFRGQDLEDLKRLVALQQDRLDAAYVRRWMVDMVGEDDERLGAWDSIVSTYGRVADG